MTELEKIEYAKSFIDKLANGINPVDNTPIREDDIVNNVRLSRCFFFVSDVLRQVIENGGVTKKKKPWMKFSLSAEQIASFPYSESPIPVSEIARRFNELSANEEMKKLSHKDLTNWLLSIGMLAQHSTANGKASKLPTQMGNDIGITTQTRIGHSGEYVVTVYSREAQAFIVDNIDAVIDMKYKK
jgi:hypothetical protein